MLTLLKLAYPIEARASMSTEQRIEAMDNGFKQINNLIEMFMKQKDSGMGIHPVTSGNQQSSSNQVTAPGKRAGIQLETTASGKAQRVVENKLTNEQTHRD